MEILLFWFLVSIAIGVWASNKGRSGFGWFLLSVVISPILAAIFLAVSSDLSQPVNQLGMDIPNRKTHVQCPDCAEYVRNEARVCKHCSCKLIPIAPPASSSTGVGGLTPRQVVGIALAILLALAVYLSA